GADYNFDSPVTSDIELTAVWQRKTISGSSEDFTLIDGTSVKSVLSSEWKYSTKTANNHVKFAGGMNGESDSRFITFVIPEGKTGKVKNATIHSSNIFVIIPESQVTEATRTFDYSNPYFSLTGSGKTEKDATVNNDMPAGKYYCGSTKSSLEISKLVITVSTAPITATFKDGEATKYAVSATANEELGNLFLDCELPVLADHDGMKFRGWYNGENPVAKTTTISASTTYTAKWQGEEHTLTWAIGEGTIKTPGTPAGQVEAGTPLTAPVVEREGYRFDGWNPEVPPVMPNDDAEYVAQWVKVYTVTYMNGTTTLGTETVDKGQKASEYTSYQNQPLATFQGWFDAATEGNAINFATKTIDDDLTAYGKWDKAYAQTANFVAAATGTKPNISTFLSGLNYAISSMDNVSWDDQPSAQADRGLKIEKSGTTLSFWVAADKCVKIKVGTLEGVDKGTAGVSVDGGASYETIYGADPQGTGEPKEYTYTTTEETLFVIKINNGCPGTGGVYQWNLIQSISITGSTPHNITLNPATNGSFTVKGLTEKVTAVEGENVALVAIPASGYMLDKWSVYKTDEEATKVTVTGNSFVMPAYAVTVSATFKEKDDYATTIDFMALADENYSKTTTPEHTANIETELSNHHYILSSMTNVSWDKPDGKPADKGLKIKNSGTTIAFDVAAKKLVVLTMGSIKNNSAKFSVDGGANYTNLVGSNPQSTGASVVTYYYSDNERTYMYATNSGDYNVIQAITITDPYKVTFANGGEIDPMYFKGTALELPAATGEGEFQGWYDAETEGKLIGMAGDKFSPASDITLYAHFVSEDADNSLAWLKYGDTDITLVPNQVEYNVTLPHDSNLPIVTYEANSEKATAGEVTQATAQTMKATFTVTAENGDEANYSVVFEYEKVLTAMAAGSYAKAVIAPASVSGTSSQYAAGLSDNAYFNTLGDASKKDGEAGTPEFKNEYIYLKGQAQMSGAIPTSRAIQFIIGTRGKLTISGKGDMRMIKEGETEAAVIGTTTAGDYEVSVLPGTYYIYATDGSRNITNIKYEIPPMGTDATLKSLKVAGYALTPEFDAETTDYSVVLDYGTTELPNVLFEKNDEFASVVKTDAESVTGTTTIEVTAEDGTTVKTYSIAFSVSTDPKFVIFDGSKMTDFGPRTFTDPVSGMSWEVGSSLSYNKNNDALSCGAKDYAHDLKMQPAKEKDGKAIRINVPEGKVCIINLVGCTGSSGNLRSVFIAKSDQAGVEDALIAYTSDQYVLEKKSIKVLGGSYYVRADASCRFYEISVEISDYDYSRSGSGYATLCLPYDVKVANTLGATFYEADYKDESVHQMYFNELDENATLNAGQAYLFYYTARTAYFVYEPETSPADEIDARGFYGVLEDTYVSYTTEGEVWHGVYGTKIQPMAEGVLIPANRAYINLSEVPTVTKVPAGMAAPRRLAFGTPRSQTTDNEQLLMNAENGVMKVIMNNHMFIFRDGKKFNAIGAPMR
ncbi:MAG: InlB B-repeat-containing protein, partial [Paludibacteraceae bacterium]|nr:InlB B-repeat-containing protein [Paludibacteraceae bacterium]